MVFWIVLVVFILKTLKRITSKVSSVVKHNPYFYYISYILFFGFISKLSLSIIYNKLDWFDIGGWKSIDYIYSKYEASIDGSVKLIERCDSGLEIESVIVLDWYLLVFTMLTFLMAHYFSQLEKKNIFK